MSNSSLVNYTRISPNKNPRKNETYNPSGKVTKITIHHTGCVASVEGLGNEFAKESRQASANYGIGSDCRVGMYAEEDYRAWTSGSRTNDYQAITIEVSNSATGGNWPVSDAVMAKLIDLCVDICQRNGIEKLNFTGNANGNLTMHKYFEATTCPGPYLESKFQWIADQVNARLEAEKVEDTTKNYTKIMGGAKATVQQMQTYVKKVNPSVPRSVIDMIPYYLSEGEAEGVRGDVAFAQSCLETGNFGFGSSTAVTLDQNNFCGMGVTSKGMKGNSFDTSQLGIRAQIQHLKAYACSDALKNGCIDPRFNYVKRGCAPYVEYLGIQENPEGKGWAAGAGYGEKILRILSNVIATSVSSTPVVQPEISSVLEVGDEVRLVSGAAYTSGKSVPSWLLSKVLYAREIRGEDIVVSTLKSGAITGVVNKKYLTKDGKPVVTPEVPVVKPEPVVTPEPVAKPEPDVSKEPEVVTLSVGDEVKLVSGAKYTSGASIPTWLFAKTLYTRELRGDNVVISTLKSGAITGVVATKYLTKNGNPVTTATKPSNSSTQTATPSSPVVAPVVTPVETFLKVGDTVKLASGATYSNGSSIPSWLFKKTLYVRELQSGDKVVVSTLKSGAITGVVLKKNLTKV